MSAASKPARGSGAAVAVDPREIDAEMIRGLYQRVRPLIVANFGALALLTFALWDTADTLALAAWAVALAAWTLLRFVLARVYMRRARPLKETWRWTLAFALGSTVAGCLWGISVVFVGDLGTDNAKLVTAFLMAALSAAAIAGYTNSLLAFAGFIAPALLPYGLRLVNLSGSPNLAIALFVAFWGLLLWIMARHLNESFRDSIALSLSNRNLAQRLRRERDRAQSASRAKSRFLGHMSHELRTPLNAVIGYADMMAQRMLGPLGNPAYEGYARDIGDSGRHMLSMIEGILDLSDLQGDGPELHKRPTDLGAVITRAAGDLRAQANSRAITIECAFPDGLPGVLGDAGRLRQVAEILIGNAIRFSAEGGLVRVSAAAAGPDRVGLEVADDGRGMDPETVAAVQTPFAQLAEQDHLVRASADPQGPTSPGLNLPLAKLLVEAHDGDFSLASAPGAGTTVSIALPAAPVPACSLHLGDGEAALSAAGAQPTPPAGKRSASG